MDLKNSLADFQMVGNRLISVKFKNPFVHIQSSKLKRSFNADYRIEGIEVLDEDFLFGKVILDVNVEVKQTSKTKLTCSISIEGAFQAKGHSESEFAEMLEINGCASLFSVARAFIASLTAQSLNGGEIILPMINVLQLKQQKQSKQEK